jgi:DNA (cytosine-5)-methyltransferase 1
MSRRLTLGSLFSGSGGFELAGLLCGIRPVFASEVEPFPVRVTTRRFPDVKHYGDVSRMDGAKVEPVDIITFGSPCTDLSVAGKRAGIGGSQSGLFFEAIRIIKEMREATDGKQPRFILWENVPGAFSSNKGEDFGAVLEAVIGVKAPGAEVPAPAGDGWPYADVYVGDGWSLAYRTLDARYFGVAQRRKRIYLVCDFGGERASEILFEPEGVCRDFTPRVCEGQEAAGGLADSPHTAVAFEPGACSRLGGHAWTDAAGALRACAGDNRTAVAIESHPQDSRIKVSEDGTVQSLPARMGTGGGNVPLTMRIRSGKDGGGKDSLIHKDISATLATHQDQTLFAPSAFGVCSKNSHSMLSDNPASGFYEAVTSRTLDRGGGNPACNQGGIAVVTFTQNQRQEVRDLNGKAGALAAESGVHQQTYVLEGNAARPSHRGEGISEDVSYTLNTVERHAVAYSLTDVSTPKAAEGIAPSITARDYKSPPAVLSCEAAGPSSYGFTQGSFTEAYEERAATLTARDYKNPQSVSYQDVTGCLTAGAHPGSFNGQDAYSDMLVANAYVVRGLTPKECARLQGFPDWWCSHLGTEEPTEEEIDFWQEVFEEHRRVVTHAAKPRSRKQIAKWLKAPHTDSAEYKMWGNGIALPCAVFALRGIVEIVSEDE